MIQPIKVQESVHAQEVCLPFAMLLWILIAPVDNSGATKGIREFGKVE
jgi:hypothetical protein